MPEWMGWAILALVVLAVFLGVRGGRRQFKADRQAATSESYAQGARDMQAAVQAGLSQHVTVVAGNDSRSYGLPRTADELGRVPDRVPDHVGVPDLEEIEIRLIRAGLMPGPLGVLGKGMTHVNRTALPAGADADAGHVELGRTGPGDARGLVEGVER